jgi:hypothetical protein
MFDVGKRYLLVAAALSLSGCVSLPTAEELVRAPAPHQSADAPAGIVDSRARFREYFCASLADCGKWLHELPDEPVTWTFAPAGRADLQVLFVTGAFSECFGEAALPFADAIEALKDGPDRFGTIVVGGRSGTEHNAAQIAAWLEAHLAESDRPLVRSGTRRGPAIFSSFLSTIPTWQQASMLLSASPVPSAALPWPTALEGFTA